MNKYLAMMIDYIMSKGYSTMNMSDIEIFKLYKELKDNE